MIAQAVLTILLGGVLLYAWVESRRSPIVAVLSLIAALAGLYFVWFPSHSTRVAEFAGVGRGVDLILYLWVCISLIVLLNLHLKLRTQHELITALARRIALTDADDRKVAITAGDAADPDAAAGHMSMQRSGRSA
jgi:small membrane protein